MPFTPEPIIPVKLIINDFVYACCTDFADMFYLHKMQHFTVTDGVVSFDYQLNISCLDMRYFCEYYSAFLQLRHVRTIVFF